MKILLTGASGQVGKRLSKLLAPTFDIIAPTHAEFDITKKNTYIHAVAPDVIIHGAAIAQANIAEPQRGSTSSSAWQINVLGTKNVVNGAKDVGAFVIFLSTASVFTSNTPRIFTEDDTPSPDKELSWYAVTKKHAEQYMKQGAIIRLSHPDPYTLRLLKDYEAGTVTSLFADQKFAVTLLEDVATAITRIIQGKRTGIYHVVSRDSCSPHAIISHLTGKALPKTPFSQFVKTAQYPLRYSQYHIIDGKKTARALDVPSRSWQQVVDSVI